METNRDDVTRRVGEEFDAIRQELSQRTKEIRDAVAEFVDERPIQSVAIAFAVGYLLSGALISRTTLRVAHLGARFAIGAFLKPLVAGVAPGMLLASLFGDKVDAAAHGDGDASTQH